MHHLDNRTFTLLGFYSSSAFCSFCLRAYKHTLKCRNQDGCLLMNFNSKICYTLKLTYTNPRIKIPCTPTPLHHPSIAFYSGHLLLSTSFLLPSPPLCIAFLQRSKAMWDLQRMRVPEAGRSQMATALAQGTHTALCNRERVFVNSKHANTPAPRKYSQTLKQKGASFSQTQEQHPRNTKNKHGLTSPSFLLLCDTWLPCTATGFAHVISAFMLQQ